MSKIKETPEQLLSRIQSGASDNDMIVMEAFEAAGVPLDDVIPRENVFTYRAWQAKGRQVAKGATSLRVTVYIPITKKGEDEKTGEEKEIKFCRPKDVSLFHISQTIPLDAPKGTKPEAWENSALVKPGTYDQQPAEQQEAEPAIVPFSRPAKPQASPAAKFRQLAERLEDAIEEKLRPMSQNWTPKRGREYASRVHDGHDLQRAKAALEALADAHEQGTLPEILQKVRTKKQVLAMTRTRADCSGGYYDYRETDEPADTSEPAVALRLLVESDESDQVRAQRKQERERREIEAAENDLRGMKIDGFFPTPVTVVERMLEEADLEVGQRILEPSAGIGTIAEAIRDRLYGEDARPEGTTLLCNELRPALAEICRRKGLVTETGDFLEWDHGGQFDRIVMNPPFERGADVQHVRFAYELLRPGGRVVALMANGAAFQKAAEWIEERGWSEPLDSNSFNSIDAFRRTGVSINLVVLDKPEDDFQLQNDPPAVKPQQFEDCDRTQQRLLIDGLDCLPGQEDLF